VTVVEPILGIIGFLVVVYLAARVIIWGIDKLYDRFFGIWDEPISFDDVEEGEISG